MFETNNGFIQVKHYLSLSTTFFIMKSTLYQLQLDPKLY